MSQGQGRQKRRVVYPQSKTLPKKKIKKLKSICFPGLYFSGRGQGTVQHRLQSRNGAAPISAVLLLKRSCRFPFHLPFPKGKLQKKGVILLLKHHHFVYLYQLIHRKYSDFTQCLSKFTQGTLRYLIVDFVFIQQRLFNRVCKAVQTTVDQHIINHKGTSGFSCHRQPWIWRSFNSEFDFGSASEQQH